jgi:hypothetical protein
MDFPETDPTSDILEKIAKEYATYYPYWVAEMLETEDVSLETIQKATERVVGPLVLAAFMMTLRQKDPQKAHEWFMSLLVSCGQLIESELNKIGMNTKVDVSGTFVHREQDRDESGQWG